MSSYQKKKKKKKKKKPPPPAAVTGLPNGATRMNMAVLDKVGDQAGVV